MVDTSSSLMGVFFWEDRGVEFDSKPFMGVHLSWEDSLCPPMRVLIVAAISWERGRMGVEAPLPGSEGVCSAVCRRRPYSPVAANWRCHHFLLHARTAPPAVPSRGHTTGPRPTSNLKTTQNPSRGKRLKICSSCELLPNHFLLETPARQTSSCVCGHPQIPPTSSREKV